MSEIIKKNLLLLIRSHNSFSTAYPYQGRGGLESIPATIGGEAGYILDRSDAGLTQTDAQLFALTPMGNLK